MGVQLCGIDNVSMDPTRLNNSFGVVWPLSVPMIYVNGGRCRDKVMLDSTVAGNQNALPRFRLTVVQA